MVFMRFFVMEAQKKLKPPLAIVAPHPVHGGGVLSSLRVVYAFAQRYFTPKIICLSFLSPVSMSLRNLRLSSSIRETIIEGMPCVEVGARFARFEPGLYWITKDLWQQVLGPYRYVFVTAGTPHVAHPAVLLNKKFVLWLASTYLDDRKHRLNASSFLHRSFEWINAPFMNVVERQVLEQATVLLPISSYTKKLCDDVLGYQRSGMWICPVPVSVVHAVGRQGKLFPLRIIAVGRFTDPRKNLKMLLGVCDLLLGTDERFCVDIVGMYPQDHHEVARLSVKYSGRLIFHGFASQEKLDDLYARAFASVITSEQEGLGIVGLDALSWGLPVVATRCGGVSDYVKPGVSGFLVELHAVAEMVSSLKFMADNPHRYEQLSRGALKLVSSCFSKEAVETRFVWALTQAYPELAEVFVPEVEQEMVGESFGGRACVSGPN